MAESVFPVKKFPEKPYSSEEKPLFHGIVRPLKDGDLEAIRPILETWVRDSGTGQILPEEVEEDLEFMRKSVRAENSRSYLVAEDTNNRTVIGVVGFMPPSDRMKEFAVTFNPAELVNAYVAKENRAGQGVGSALVRGIEMTAKAKGHTEIVLNSGPRYQKTAWGFYDQLPGFQRVGIAEKLYGDRNAPVWRKLL
ncbi:MAG: GNAT family N-acetyltransferase [Patescibacteria group bacterium]